MIQKKMSSDITKMQSKSLFGFTPRQVIYSVVAFIVGLVMNKILGFVNFETRGFIIILTAAPFLACGWIKVQGLPFENYMMITIKFAFSQRERVYENEE